MIHSPLGIISIVDMVYILDIAGSLFTSDVFHHPYTSSLTTQ